MVLLLTLLSIGAVLLLFAVVAFYLVKIVEALQSIGGEPSGYSSSGSYLSKIAFGVRAIEQQTGHLGPEVTRLNEGLGQVAAGLQSVDGHLVRTIAAVQRQEGS